MVFCQTPPSDPVLDPINVVWFLTSLAELPSPSLVKGQTSYGFFSAPFPNMYMCGLKVQKNSEKSVSFKMRKYSIYSPSEFRSAGYGSFQQIFKFP